MFRASSILVAAALAVSAAPASAGSNKPRLPSPESHPTTHAQNLNDIEAIDFGVKDGTSNTIMYAERRASFSIDIGCSEAVRNRTVTPSTRSAERAPLKGGPNGIIAVLIDL